MPLVKLSEEEKKTLLCDKEFKKGYRRNPTDSFPFNGNTVSYFYLDSMYIHDSGRLYRQDNLPKKEVEKLIIASMLEAKKHHVQNLLFFHFFDIKLDVEYFVPLFVENPENACYFAETFGSRKELKQAACRDPQWASYYARYVDYQRSKEVEEAIKGTKYESDYIWWFNLNDKIKRFARS